MFACRVLSEWAWLDVDKAVAIAAAAVVVASLNPLKRPVLTLLSARRQTTYPPTGRPTLPLLHPEGFFLHPAALVTLNPGRECRLRGGARAGCAVIFRPPNGECPAMLGLALQKMCDNAITLHARYMTVSLL